MIDLSAHRAARIDDEHDDGADPGVLPAGTVVGNYRIERPLADGGMGSVYEATHRILPRRAAIKVLHRSLLGKWAARERLFQEARILEVLDHPGLVRIYDVGLLDDDRPWIAMELLEGVTLAQRLTVHGRLDPLEVIDVIDRAAAALDAAHAAGVIHRDLKPENIMVCRAGGALTVKVIDWGIARVQGEPTGRLTRANMTPGTPLYMSPEQARGKVVDGRSDIYALGVIACEALCGEPPFQGDSPLDVVIQHLTAEPEPLCRRRADLPPALDALVLEMLAKEPHDRPPIPEIRARLAAIADEIREERDEPEIEIELELEVDDAPVIARPRWTPEETVQAPRARVVASSGGRTEVAGEIVALDRQRGNARVEVLGMIVIAFLTAMMLAVALALPALQL